MNTDFPTRLSPLPSGDLMLIQDGAGRELAVFGGTVWVTQSNDGRDIFLHHGDTFRIEQDGTTIVEALADAQVVLLPPTLDAPVPTGPSLALAGSAALAIVCGFALGLYGGNEPLHASAAQLAVHAELHR